MEIIELRQQLTTYQTKEKPANITNLTCSLLVAVKKHGQNGWML